MADQFKITGITETMEMLDELPKYMVLHGFYKALDATAVVIESAIRPRIPHLTGELAAALTHDITLDSNYRGGMAEIHFGNQGAKALWVEYGHRLVSHKPEMKLIGEVEPHPFIRPGAMAATEPSIDAFAASIGQTIDEFSNSRKVA